jgi:hypothetical protein
MLSLWAVGRDLQYSARSYDALHVLDNPKVTIALITQMEQGGEQENLILSLRKSFDIKA